MLRDIALNYLSIKYITTHVCVFLEIMKEQLLGTRNETRANKLVGPIASIICKFSHVRHQSAVLSKI